MAEQRGLAPVAALKRLLVLRGREARGLQGAEPQGRMAMVAALEAQGFVARPVRAQLAELGALDLPTLLQGAGDLWWILRARTPQGFLVEGEGGPVDLDAAHLGERFLGWALELREASPRSRTVWRGALHLLAGQRRMLAQVGAATLGLQLLALLAPQFTRLAMDQALPEGGDSLLTLVVLGMASVALFQAWVGWLRQRTILYLEVRLEAGLGRDFIAHLLSLPFPFLHGKRLGDLLQAHSGLDAARNLMTERLLGSLLDGVMGLLFLAVMAASFPAPTGAVVLVSVVTAALVVGVGRAQADLQAREVEAQARERGYLVELIKGIGTVKAAGAEAPSLSRWLKVLGEELRLSLRRQRVGLWSEVGLEGLRQGLTVALLIWGGKLVLVGEAKVGSLMAFVQMSGAYLGAVLGVAQAYLGLRVLKPQLAKTHEILAMEPEAPAPESKGGLEGPVRLQDVWFRYGAEYPWIFKGYDLQVEPGEKRWLHAPSGFGKSTLLRLIAGLHPPERGAVSVGGLEPAAAKKHLVYLPQFAQIYGGSILENLRLLSGGAADHERLMEAARTTGLDRLVATLPMGYNTVLAQGGGNLSGGQRQLVALTAVMASDRKLILLDEAMANLDWVSRAWLHDSPWFRDKTVIYASHDAGLS
ncbi:MAG TPA: ABC transporter transmembrane domain-containing protein [Holophagaceae bacterium]|nr:ABC transporter transmembrane domain-containing protein [Holophagaceae bacterium]